MTTITPSDCATTMRRVVSELRDEAMHYAERGGLSHHDIIIVGNAAVGAYRHGADFAESMQCAERIADSLAGASAVAA